jgi:hypothetical protein
MPGKITANSEWDRSPFAMSSDELDVHEALTSLRRLLGASWLHSDTLQAVQLAYERLTIENSSGS